MTTLKTVIRKTICLLLALIMISVTANVAFAANINYPGGVTEQVAAQSARKTDMLVKNAVNALTGKSLSSLVMTEMLKDETLSTILTSVYSSLGEQQDSLSGLGIDVSPKNVAVGLSAYPSVARLLAAADDWQSVNLSKAKWGISTKTGFANAVSAMLSPFNDLLYMILCSGSYRVSLINLNGDDGYKNGVVSMLKALGCTSITSPESFKAQADKNKGSMVTNIIMSVFSMLDELLASPVIKLTSMLPDLAIYINDGGLEQSVDSLMKPLSLHIGNYVNLFTGSQMLSVLMFIQDPQKYTMNFRDNITLTVNDMISSSGFRVADIDLEALASCKGSTGKAFTAMFYWLLETLKLNRDSISGMMPEEMPVDISAAFSFFDKVSKEYIFVEYINLLNSTEGEEYEYEWQDMPFTKTNVSYTENLGKREFKRVLKGIDKTIDEFAVEFGGGSSLQTTLKTTVYSSSTITQLAKGLYSALGGEEIAPVASMLSIPVKPASLASLLSPGRFASARQTLYKYSSWDSITNIYWGFSAGDRNGFEQALIAVLSPFEPIFEALLANGSFTILDTIHIGGSSGYNTAVIPLLEALSCPQESIKTYDEYVRGKGTDAILKDVLDPVLDLADEIFKKPVFTLTKILPNAVYFIENGSMMQCVENLLYPFTKLLSQLGITPESLGLNLGDIENTDILSTVSEMAGSLTGDIKLETPDLKALAGMGELVKVNSARTYNGERMTVGYVKADQTAVLVSILRYVVDIIRNPENGDLVGSMMGGNAGAGEADMFAQFSSGIGDEMAKMTTDETIEWLYKLFFRERAVREEPEDDGYVPKVIYVPPKNNTARNAGISAGAIILFAAAAVAIIKRRKIKIFLDERKEQKLFEKRKAESEQEV